MVYYLGYCGPTFHLCVIMGQYDGNNKINIGFVNMTWWFSKSLMKVNRLKYDILKKLISQLVVII
jgi:hypothetical protein